MREDDRSNSTSGSALQTLYVWHVNTARQLEQWASVPAFAIGQMFRRMARDRRKFAKQLEDHADQRLQTDAHSPEERTLGEIQAGEQDVTHWLMDRVLDDLARVERLYDQALRRTTGQAVNRVLVNQNRRLYEDRAALATLRTMLPSKSKPTQ